VTGYAILRSRAWTGTEVFGGIVDVSAGGTRLRVKPGTRLRPGEVWALDLEVSLPHLPPSSAPVRLWGAGAVLRVVDSHRRGTEVAVRFESPLRVVEGVGPRSDRTSLSASPAR
jgi:hypothetical protein